MCVCVCVCVCVHGDGAEGDAKRGLLHCDELCVSVDQLDMGTTKRGRRLQDNMNTGHFAREEEFSSFFSFFFFSFFVVVFETIIDFV